MVLIKKYGIWLVLLLTLIATAWTSKQDVDSEIVVQTGNRGAVFSGDETVYSSQHNTELVNEAQVSATGITEPFALRPQNHELGQNIFTAFTAAQAPVELYAAPAIEAVTNPFIYAGKVIEDGRWVVFLLDGEKSHAVKLGDVIEEVWKIKSITPPTMTLNNIPLKVDVQIEIGANS